VHTKIGLAVFCLVLLQVFFGYFRPHAPHPPPAPATTDATSPTTSSDKANNKTQGGSSSISKTIRGTDDGDIGDANEVALQVPPEEQPKATITAEKKTMARFVWEIGHRLLGVILVSLAWTNCTTGIEIFTDDYNDVDNATTIWTFIFWCVAGGIGIFMLLLGIVQRVY
jgi:hypothetical protein